MLAAFLRIISERAQRPVATANGQEPRIGTDGEGRNVVRADRSTQIDHAPRVPIPNPEFAVGAANEKHPTERVARQAADPTFLTNGKKLRRRVGILSQQIRV